MVDNGIVFNLASVRHEGAVNHWSNSTCTQLKQHSDGHKWQQSTILYAIKWPTIRKNRENGRLLAAGCWLCLPHCLWVHGWRWWQLSGSGICVQSSASTKQAIKWKKLEHKNKITELYLQTNICIEQIKCWQQKRTRGKWVGLGRRGNSTIVLNCYVVVVLLLSFYFAVNNAFNMHVPEAEALFRLTSVLATQNTQRMWCNKTSD